MLQKLLNIVGGGHHIRNIPAISTAPAVGRSIAAPIPDSMFMTDSFYSVKQGAETKTKNPGTRQIGAVGILLGS